MKHKTSYFLSLVLISLALWAPTGAYAEDSSSSLKKKYKEYKSYSPKKKARIQKKWSSFKSDTSWDSLSSEQKRKLREKVLKKAQDN